MIIMRSNGRRIFNWHPGNWMLTLSRYGFACVGPSRGYRITFPRPNPERRIFKAMHGRKTP